MEIFIDETIFNVEAPNIAQIILYIFYKFRIFTIWINLNHETQSNPDTENWEKEHSIKINRFCILSKLDFTLPFSALYGIHYLHFRRGFEKMFHTTYFEPHPLAKLLWLRFSSFESGGMVVLHVTSKEFALDLSLVFDLVLTIIPLWVRNQTYPWSILCL